MKRSGAVLAVLLCSLLAGLFARAARAEPDIAAKASAFRNALVERHVASEGFLMYEVDLRRELDSAHQDALADTPTFTGLWAAASCDRAGYEWGASRKQALADAAHALDGLQFLMDVTGRPGLLARGVIRAPVPDEPGRDWFPGAPGFEDYAWRGDTSQDQYANGLLPAVAACRRHLPERSRALVTAVAGLLLETGMKLVDPDGRRTTYGDLSKRAGWGFNSIGKLTGYAVFALAAELDADPRWSAQRDRLRDRDRVVASSLTTNLKILGITNYSNDLMAWSLYRVLVPLARRTGDPALESLERGMHRAWKRVAPDRNAYFTALWCELEPAECSAELRAGVAETLARFPLEKRRLGPSPELAALPRNWLPGRKWKRRARNFVPLEIRPPASLEWKASPYRLTDRTLPDQEYTGLDYLMVYWLARPWLAREDEAQARARAAAGR